MIINIEKGIFCSRESMPLEGRLKLPAATSCMLILDGDCIAEGPQEKLVHKRGFSKLIFKNMYWQFPMREMSIEKTAFCPGPGSGN